MKSLKILVACHKKCDLPKNECFLPIHVGKSLTSLELGLQGDNDGENISHKNKQYSELTAVYWAWKNLKSTDFIGLCHYRRFFDMDFSVETVSRMLSKADVILATPEVRPFSNAVLMERLISKEDLYILISSILRLYPDYRNAVIDYYFNSNKWHRFNMFICNWNLFSDYASFMFRVLGEVEKNMRPSGYSRINRGIGYMGESLWAVYCMHHHLTIKYVNVYNLDYPNKPGIKSKLMQWQRNTRKNIAFFIARGFPRKKITMPDAVLTGFKNDKMNTGIIDLLSNKNLVSDSVE